MDPRSPEVTRAFGRIREAGGKVLRVAYVDRPDGRYVLSSHFDARDAEAQLMRMTYDPAADAMYLYLTERSPGTPDVARTEEVATGVMLDFDAEDRVIGIEVLAVSRLPDAKPMQMVFEVLTPSDAVAAAK